jgi:hypothetical protein
MTIQFRSLLFCSWLILSSIISRSQTSNTVDSSEVDQRVFEKVEFNASYPGGLPAWKSFLIKNLKATTPVDNGAPAGYYTVYVRFVVSREGIVSDIKALSNLGYGMEPEVIRILKKSGNWSPAMQNNRYVNSYHTQPVTFVVENDGLNITTQVPHKLFTGIDNEIKVEADRIKPGDLNLTITNGRIISGQDGYYKVKVIDTTRRTVITVYNAKKKDKEIGAESFEVRPQSEAGDAKKD